MTAEAARDAAIHAYLALLAEQPAGTVGLAAVAARAGIPLAQMRADFADEGDLVAGFARLVDRHVLAEGGPDDEGFAGEGPRERLFEVLMRRLDALEPHRAAVRALSAAARRDPLFALRLLRIAERSQRWMLAAAGIDCSGLAGAVRAKGLALLFARIVSVWLDDDDPGLSRTMAALDRELATGGKLLGMLDDLAFLAAPWRPRRRRFSSAPEAPAPAVEPEA